jgi:hypothetical protein
VSTAEYPSIAFPGVLAYHRYGTGETLPLDAPIFRPGGDQMQEYRIKAGFYCTGDSMALTLSADKFRQFLQMQAVSRISPALLQMFTPRGVIGEREELSERQKLVKRIVARRNAIAARTGMLPESHSFIREDRER